MSLHHVPGRPRGSRSAGLLAAAASLGSALALSLPSMAAAPAAQSYAVATESAAATREASRVLEAGGNAIDAMVCAALTSGLTNPSSSGIGGGGFALVWSGRDKRASVLDFRETAPAGIEPSSLDARPVAEAQRGVTVGVPGEVAGLFELHQRFGKTPWKTLVLRAAQLAEQGFAASAYTIAAVDNQSKGPLPRSATFRSVYLPGGGAAKPAQLLRAAKLASTLRRIASEGKRGFYEGVVASDIVRATQSAGGSLALTDLAGYRTVSREPLQASWDGKTVLTMPPPSAGGLLLAQTLALFSRAELAELKSTPGKRIHLLAEGMRGAFADRARYLGDPAFVPLELAKLLAPARLARRKALMADDRTHSQPRFGLEEAGTHHLVAADQEGNWISLTTTVNEAFGAKLIAEQTGILLNNELLDFSTPESIAVFGQRLSPNRPRPGARPISSMTPTLVLDGGVPILALGGSGATTIAPNVTQVLLNRLLGEASAEQAVTAPRFTIPAPRSGQTLWLESELTRAYGADLQARGELLLTRDSANAVQLIARDAGQFSAAADPRKAGTVSVRNTN